MRPLATNQNILAWLGAYSPSETVRLCKKLSYSMFTFAIFLVSLCALTSSTIFFVQYASVNLEDSLYALFQIFAYLSVAYMIIVTFFLGPKITSILKTITKIYKSCKYYFGFFFINSI